MSSGSTLDAERPSGSVFDSAELTRPAGIHPFWLFAALHVLFWTLLPVLLHPNAPLDVVEEIAWGREWQWGYYKHPPLTSWLANVAYLASGGKLWSIFLLSQLCIFGAFWVVWKTAREFVDDSRAFAAVVLLEGIIYYNFTAPEFNPNVLELPFWTLIVYFAWRAMTTMRTSQWIWLGVFAGLGLLTKYYTLVLLFAVSLAFLLDPARRKSGLKPLFAIAAAGLIVTPHVRWLFANHFPTFSYAIDRASAKKTLWTHVQYPLHFAGAQLIAVLFAVLAFGMLFRARPRLPAWRSSRPAQFLSVVIVVPVVATLLISLLMNWRLRSMWGAPLWSFLPLLLVLGLPSSAIAGRRTQILRTGLVLMAVMAIAFSIPLTVGPYIYKKPREALFDGERMTAAFSESWRARISQPLQVVVGDTWLAGNVAFYSSDRPHIFTDANPSFSPWIKPQKLQASGALVMWNREAQMPERYRIAFPKAQLQTPIVVGWHTAKKVEPMTVYWAIVPPER